MRIVDALFSEVETTKWSFCGQFRLTTSKVYKRSSISLKTLMPSIYIRLQKYLRNNCVVGNIISIPSTHEEKCEYSLHTTMHLGVSMSMSQCGLSELKEKKILRIGYETSPKNTKRKAKRAHKPRFWSLIRIVK